jgi:cell division protein FtsB
MKTPKRRLFRLVTFGIGVFIIVSLARSVYGLWRRTDIVRQRREEVTKLEEENRQLQEKLSEVQSPDFIEQQARDKLGLLKEDEIVVLIETPTPASVGAMPTSMNDSKSLKWREWWKLFF